LYGHIIIGGTESVSMQLLRLNTADAIARILIDHPQRRNALTRAMWRELPRLVAQALADPQVRVLVLQGAQPGMFAAGADISEFEQTYAEAAEAVRANEEIQAAEDALAASPVPVVALIDGACVGGGVGLALACDFRIASTRARFAVTPAKLGLSYHPTDLQRLVRACGLGAASELLYGGQVWDAARALETGLVNQVLATEEYLTTTDALLAAIAANSLAANQAIKRGLQAVVSGSAEALALSAQDFQALFCAPDFTEGRDAFLQRRPAVFPSHRKPR
jgi:enoyl-CoA hydratase/carnithine racemase